MRAAVVLAFAVLGPASVGCGGETPREPAATAVDPTSTAIPAETEAWTEGIVDRERPEAFVATLVAVRAARQAGFDRVVFEFTGASVPGFHVEYVDRPVRACGSGEVVPLAGDGWLAVRLVPARAHDEEGRPTAGPRALAPRLPIVIEIARTCDFEAVVEYVLGVASPNRYRVFELADPPRLVVDVRNSGR